ncbi:hypothetical protein [Lysobacter antibioticus]|uniref:ATP dependent DNA ligase n=1 Tax=Lysobacter TaxID=68 RepID=UPI00068F90BE|nr:hypothetical protein [Lysobacter antibioticus]
MAPAIIDISGRIEPVADIARSRIDWAGLASLLLGAKPAEWPVEAFEPQRAVAGPSPPNDGKWLHELEWHGQRMLAVIADGRARLWSGDGAEWTERVPAIVEALERLGLQSAAFDGELIVGAGAEADYAALQAVLSGDRCEPLTYMLFDLLQIDGIGIERAPLVDRKAVLEHLLRQAPRELAYSSHILGNGDIARAVSVNQCFDGLISKRAFASYMRGCSPDWRKTRLLQSSQFAVVGYTPPGVRHADRGFGSLLLAQPKGKAAWHYAGQARGDFNSALIAELGSRLKGGTIKPTVTVSPDVREIPGALWFKPRFVVEIDSHGFDASGLLRHGLLRLVCPNRSVASLRSGK